MRKIILLILFSYYYLGLSQSIYYSSHEDLAVLDSIITKIGKINLLTCNKNILYSDSTNSSNGYGEWLDITTCPDGNVYGLSHDGVYLIDFPNQAQIKIFEPMLPIRYWEEGITCTKDSVLIFGGRDFVSYDLNTHFSKYYGRMPPGTGISSNLFWFHGKLMGSGLNKILEIDTNDLSNIIVYCTLPFSGFISLTEVAISCDSVAVFAIHGNGDIYLFDTTNFSVSFYCSIPKSPTETFQGSTPNFMFMPPEPCKIGLDLDRNDQTMTGFDTRDSIFCSLPSQYIFTDIEMYSDKPWDSLLVWIDQGPSGVFLNGVKPVFAILAGQNTDRLKFYPSALSDFTALQDYLSALIITGEMPDGISNMKIGFCGWAGHLISDTAYAYVTLISRNTTAGADTSATLCINDLPLNLNNLLSLNTTPGGEWPNSLSVDGFFDPKTDVPKQYSYIVFDPICSPDTAEFDLSIYKEPILDLGPDQLLCANDTIKLSVNVPGCSISWSNGETSPRINVTQPQMLKVELMDAYGCIYSDSITIRPDLTCLIEQIYIPNIFSPDGNGINDFFDIEGNSTITDLEFAVYDRWGNQLYYEKNQTIHWNGRSNRNEIIPGGVYAYKLKVQAGIQSFFKIGDITLLR